MTTVAPDPAGESLTRLYMDVLWTLVSSGRMMRTRLPIWLGLASDPELAMVLADAVRLTTEHGERLEATASRFNQPTTRHAAELEALLVSVASETTGWHPGVPRDLALACVLRSAVHLAIPPCDLAMSLAPVVGYPAHKQVLAKMWDDMTAMDASLRRITESLIGPQGAAESPARSRVVAEAEGAAYPRRGVGGPESARP